jgi:acyl carrier protein
MAMTVVPAEVLDEVVAAVRLLDTTPTDSEISAPTEIAELGIDSLAMMSLVATFEERWHVSLADDELLDVVTVGDLVALIMRRLETRVWPSR